MGRASPVRWTQFIVPWWHEAMDGRAVGDPETTVELPGEIAHGLVISHPFGSVDQMLMIHAVLHTQVITAAIDADIAVSVTLEPLSGSQRADRFTADTGDDA
jgi:hypothetical protein